MFSACEPAVKDFERRTMNEKGDSALVPRSPSALEKTKPGTKRIVLGMVTDTLALANRDSLAPAAPKFRIGDHALCEPDYLQLIAWAEDLNLSPLEVVRRLREGLRRKGNETKIENGKLIELNWDVGLLPISNFRISFPLELTELSFARYDVDGNFEDLEEGVGELPEGYCLSARIHQISAVALPKLQRLNCASVGLESMAMAPALALERLDCSWNRVSTLDLLSFPNLKLLDCADNRVLESLDLKPVPELLELDCHMNRIKELDLSPASKLRKLNCSDNFMDELVLPYLPELVELVCSNGQYNGKPGYLTRIDLRNTPNLKVLDCGRNDIKTLNLSAVPRLRELDCGYNRLAELDLSPVPMLLKLDCCRTCLRELDLSGVPMLVELDCCWTDLRELDLSRVPMLKRLSCYTESYDSAWVESLDIRPLHHLAELSYDQRTRLIQRTDQHFSSDEE